MGSYQVIENIIEERLLRMHTCYIGRILALDGAYANIQPLQMIKQYGKDAVTCSVIPSVPIIESARYKLNEKTITVLTPGQKGCFGSLDTDVTVKGEAVAEGEEMESTGKILAEIPVTCSCKEEAITIYEKVPLQAGDLVVCVCGERDITESKNGNIAQPALVHHSMSDSIVVGVL